jgi:hypothetical protein
MRCSIDTLYGISGIVITIMGTIASVNLVGGRSVERYSSASWAVVDGKPGLA